MKNLLILLLLGIVSACGKSGVISTYSVIPLPAEIKLKQEPPFLLDSDVVIAFPANNELMKKNAEFLSDYIRQSLGLSLLIRPLEKEGYLDNAIVLQLTDSISHEEGYRFFVKENGILLEGRSPKGVFYGIQTLRKSLPVSDSTGTVSLSAVTVNDAPRFTYRGMHLDVARHFFSVDFVKRYIDLLALHNMNTLHWHLTDDQGWRIDIKKYPKLAEIASVRHRTVKGYLGSGEYDHTSYGGYYTQDQLREVVAYANERFIQVIPEIDLPGHMLAVLAAYPELGCTGGPYEVSPDWGVFEDVLCVGNEKAMHFLEDVMLEVMEIFPSKYIHIGGDEAPRTRWKSCRKCQARIRQEGLKGNHTHTPEDMLQSYCMKRIEKFLNAHGRQIIGWDELLEGEVAPNATVMSWRGSAGGIKAAQMGHDVIMTPNTHCYFDFYQTDDTKNEPLAIGGYIPFEKVYGLEPTEGLNSEQSNHILGVQANVWTEYITTEEHLEYMVLPRMAALCEVQWTAPEKKDLDFFTARLPKLMRIYHRDGYNFAKHAYDIKAEFRADTVKRNINVLLNTIDDAPVYYTLDGSSPTVNDSRYEEGICISESAILKAVAIHNGVIGKPIEKQFNFNKATLASIHFVDCRPVPNYSFEGPVTLVDAMSGNENFSTGAWLGFQQEKVEMCIDLREMCRISTVGVNAMTYMDAWIMGPVRMQVSVSADNKHFVNQSDVSFPLETDVKKRMIKHYAASFEEVEARYVRIEVWGSPSLPEGHVSRGERPFLFMDEIQID